MKRVLTFIVAVVVVSIRFAKFSSFLVVISDSYRTIQGGINQFGTLRQWIQKETVRDTTITPHESIQLREEGQKRKQKQSIGEDVRPLQVFILSGQSNMVGMGSLDHMRLLIQETYNDTTYRETLWDTETDSYKQRNDVYMKYNENHGYLTLGSTTGFAGGNAFGPELMFGWTIGNYINNKKINKHTKQRIRSSREVRVPPPHNNMRTEDRPDALLLKVAWGGRNLAIDFRPPSSGEGTYNNVKPVQYGWEYRQLITDTLAAISTLDQYIPGYNTTNATMQYELAGFVWFQGWNDMLVQQMVDEYEFNLGNFIRDVRLDLDAPNLPFVIGELGMSGMNVSGRSAGRVLGMRKAQQDVCLQPEFQNTTRFVRTAPFAVLDGAVYNGIYHYNGRADTYFHIGEAFGKGMIELLQ